MASLSGQAPAPPRAGPWSGRPSTPLYVPGSTDTNLYRIPKTGDAAIPFTLLGGAAGAPTFDGTNSIICVGTSPAHEEKASRFGRITIYSIDAAVKNAPFSFHINDCAPCYGDNQGPLIVTIYDLGW